MRCRTCKIWKELFSSLSESWNRNARRGPLSCRLSIFSEGFSAWSIHPISKTKKRPPPRTPSKRWKYKPDIRYNLAGNIMQIESNMRWKKMMVTKWGKCKRVMTKWGKYKRVMAKWKQFGGVVWAHIPARCARWEEGRRSCSRPSLHARHYTQINASRSVFSYLWWKLTIAITIAIAISVVTEIHGLEILHSAINVASMWPHSHLNDLRISFRSSWVARRLQLDWRCSPSSEYVKGREIMIY